ncbi:9572_t:CDS:1 [Funneliformis geosporum]|uniref:5380_t:CDS:1 n=1 Tax=Funneliformis geosporum TaxID=1117311 RepID=A0A9W4SQ46_9GLOM|nr:9572_t:CDS:1 [Funneliformis geosporum]CAI2175108.1 5380_t:CDS:1 [Funneliformis geosporum]
MEILMTPFAKPIPIESNYIARFRWDRTVVNHFIIDKNELNDGYLTAPGISTSIENALRRTLSFGGEINLSSLINCIIQYPLEDFSDVHGLIKFPIARNISDNPSTETVKNLRTDFLVWLNGKILIFKGEDKRYYEEFALAENELTSKMKSWSILSYGRVPYIFAYAAAGNALKFYAINQDRELRSVSHLFDLSTQKDRLFTIVITVNIYRILLSFVDLIPDYSIKLYDELSHSHNTTISILDDCIVKTIGKYSTFMNDNFSVMKNFYKDTAHVANLIHARDLNGRPSYPTLQGNRYRVILSPLGYCYEPQNESELKDVIKTVLKVINEIHSIGYVHRDIRWPNILRQPNGDWLVIDLEYGGKADEAPNFGPFIEWSPEATANDVYKTQYDIYQIGRLMASKLFFKSEECVDLQEKLLATSDQYFTGKEALSHKWFNC